MSCALGEGDSNNNTVTSVFGQSSAQLGQLLRSSEPAEMWKKLLNAFRTYIPLLNQYPLHSTDFDNIKFDMDYLMLSDSHSDSDTHILLNIAAISRSSKVSK